MIMETERKQKKLFFIGISVCLILLLVICGSYAWFTLQLRGTKANVLKAGDLTLILDEENKIGVRDDNAVPT